MSYIQGGRGQVVKAVGCDSTIRGFKSRRSPIIIEYLQLKFIYLNNFISPPKKVYLTYYLIFKPYYT